MTDPAKRGPGRPPGSTKADARREKLALRFTAEELAAVTTAAEHAGESISEWARARLVRAARRRSTAP